VIAVAAEIVNAIAPEGEVVCSEYCLKPAVSELAKGEQGAVTEGREHMSVSSS
jgi:hypothetical protein